MARQCESCGVKVPSFMPRRKVAGLRVCDECATDGVGMAGDALAARQDMVYGVAQTHSAFDAGLAEGDTFLMRQGLDEVPVGVGHEGVVTRRGDRTAAGETAGNVPDDSPLSEWMYSGVYSGSVTDQWSTRWPKATLKVTLFSDGIAYGDLVGPDDYNIGPSISGRSADEVATKLMQSYRERFGNYASRKTATNDGEYARFLNSVHEGLGDAWAAASPQGDPLGYEEMYANLTMMEEAQVQQWYANHYGFMQTVAHDSGDGETIYHCPFCGSGNVVARSDASTECGHCTTTFTVQVQPSHPFTPQTINGQPYNDPDMPGQVTDPGAEGTQPAIPPEDESTPGNESLVFVPPGQGEPFDPSKDPQQVAAKLAATKLYLLTAAGDPLDEESFVRHIAIKHADDPRAVIAEVRAERV